MKKKKNVEPISIRREIKNFYKRWNISMNSDESYMSFRNRVLNILKEIFGHTLVNGEFISEYLKYVGEKATSVVESSLTTFDFGNERYDLSKDSPIYKIIDNCTDFLKLIFYLQAFFWCQKINKSTKKEMYQKIKKAINISFVPVGLVFKNKKYDFYPAGAKFLDSKLVNDLLDWLDDYPEVRKHFNLSLKQYMKKESSRNILDNLRFSLEQLLKKILNNQKSLENQKNKLFEFLKVKNVNQEIINMYNTLISQYTKYQNENVKHNEKISEGEIEFIIYLTGSFMRFLIQVKEK